MTCKMCKERGKTWQGSDPVCYFDDAEGNWNCATINAIRDIFAPDGWWVEPDNLPEGVTAVFGEDTTSGLILVQDVEELYENKTETFHECLYVQWYKRHGHTDCLWLLGDDMPPRRPIEKELLAVIEYYKSATNPDQNYVRRVEK